MLGIATNLLIRINGFFTGPGFSPHITRAGICVGEFDRLLLQQFDVGLDTHRRAATVSFEVGLAHASASGPCFPPA